MLTLNSEGGLEMVRVWETLYAGGGQRILLQGHNLPEDLKPFPGTNQYILVRYLKLNYEFHFLAACIQMRDGVQ